MTFQDNNFLIQMYLGAYIPVLNDLRRAQERAGSLSEKHGIKLLIKTMMNKKTIVLGISSGIAAYKMLDLVILFKNKNYDVEVIMTKSAVKMMSPKLIEEILGKKVYTELFPDNFTYEDILKERKVEHIEIAKKASLFVVAPATANTIGKIANGIADDFLTTSLLATTAPVLICPSMNTNMWNHPSVQQNIYKIQNFGYFILHPESGSLACGTEGIGRLAHIDCIFQEIKKNLKTSQQLKSKKIIVTAGGTSEPVDKVRILSNRSSGKMGIALAEECFRRSADVLLLRTNSSIRSHLPIEQKTYETSAELKKLIQENIQNIDALFHVAAVSDFTIDPLQGKIESTRSYTLNLNPAPKIIDEIKKWNPKIKLIGFKAVFNYTQEQIKNKIKEKFEQTKADYFIVNDVSQEGVGFTVDTNEVTIISKNGEMIKVDKAPKREIARKILDYIKL